MKNNTNVNNQPLAENNFVVYDESKCPVRASMKIIGGKWKLILINMINQESPARFGILKKRAEGITQSMLTSMLRELEHDGIIKRKVYAEVPPKVEYTLTDLGQTLLPLIATIAQWGKEHCLDGHLVKSGG